MKKKMLLFSTVIVFLLAACNSGPGSSDPKAVLTSFFNALAKQDLKEARKYATKESEQMFSMMEMGMAMAKSMNTTKIEEEFKEFDKANIEIGDAVIDGDRAVVPVNNKKANTSVNFILKKVDGAWKVAFDQATMAEMASEKMKEDGGSTAAGIDSVKSAIRNMNMDSMKAMMQKSQELMDSFNKVNESLKQLPK